MLPDENRASVPLSWPPPNNLPSQRGLGFGCVSARTGQHRIDYCWSHKTASQGRKEGWWWGMGDSGGGEKLAFNEWGKSTWTMKHGSPHVCALIQTAWPGKKLWKQHAHCNKRDYTTTPGKKNHNHNLSLCQLFLSDWIDSGLASGETHRKWLLTEPSCFWTVSGCIQKSYSLVKI